MTFSHLQKSILILLVVTALLFVSGCSKKHKSSRSGIPTSGLPGGGTTGGGGGGANGGGNPGDSNELDLSWTVVEQSSQADLEYMVDRIKMFNKGLWIGTEGQSYLRNQTLSDGSSSGNVVVNRVKGAMGNPPAYCTSGGGSWKITLSTGQIQTHGFLHELGHGWVGPWHTEEYNCLNQSANTCAQGMMILGSGPAEGRLNWCDPSNCTGGQQCWNQIKQTHGWSHPGPGIGSAEPTCNVTIQ
ncbi:MAG: hypothetical protein E3J72_14370 [Planctomycetota bacterium]|nr:MAG: hypothetical protein E3J72_14370 [Planctomycetota bacterium]